MAAYGLYSHIQSNRRRSVMLLIGCSSSSTSWSMPAHWWPKASTVDADINTLMRRGVGRPDPRRAMGDARHGGVDRDRLFLPSVDDRCGHRRPRGAAHEQPRLYNLLENLCISRGITMPKLKVMDDDALNAFATGMNEKQYSITVTSGLLKRLDDRGVEAVLGHELTHIRNGDVRMMVIAVIIAGAISFFAELFFRLWFNAGFSFRGSRSSGSERPQGRRRSSILIAVGLIVSPGCCRS